MVAIKENNKIQWQQKVTVKVKHKVLDLKQAIAYTMMTGNSQRDNYFHTHSEAIVIFLSVLECEDAELL